MSQQQQQKGKGADKDVESKINEIMVEGSTFVKMEIDYSATVDEKIPVAKQMAGQGKLQEALELLLSLEKQTRTGADMHSTSKILIAIVQLCYEVRTIIIRKEFRTPGNVPRSVIV